MNKCDHTSVGVIVWRDNKLLLIERKKPPFGFAPPAGHVDDNKSYFTAAVQELKEEVGLTVTKMSILIGGRKSNVCRREDGTYHDWQIFRAEADGEVIPSPDETKSFRWVTLQELKQLRGRTMAYIDNQISQEEWEQSPGLELVWVQWFNDLGITTNE